MVMVIKMNEQKKSIAKKINLPDSQLAKEFTLFILDYIKNRKTTIKKISLEFGVDVTTISRWKKNKHKCSLLNIYNIIYIIGYDAFEKFLEDKYLK